MIRWILLLAILLAFFSGTPPEKWEPLGMIPVKSQFMTTDYLGNIYVIEPGNVISKFDSTGHLSVKDNLKLRGDIYSLDATNPLELQVYFQTNGKVIFLDNMLVYRGETDLVKNGFPIVMCSCRSFDNGLWIYDASDLTFKRILKSGQIMQKSNNAQSLGLEENSPLYMVDLQDKLLVSMENNGVFQLDIQANFKRKFPLSGLREFQADALNITWSDSFNMHQYHCLSGKKTSIRLPEIQGILQVRKENNIYYIRTPSNIYIYRLTH